MAQVIKTTFQLRRGLLEAWERNNPILAKGEPSFVIDKNALKIGDGITPWKELEYIGLNQAGDDYVLTDADKAEIAGIAAGMVEVPEVNIIPSDWNAPEGEPGHVLNRTHWVEDVLVEIPVVGKWSIGGGDFTFEEPFLEVGKKYLITWERTGVVYESVAWRDGNTLLLGNGDSTQEVEYPFNIYQYPSGYTSLAMTNDGQARDPFSIKAVNKVYHEINHEFLPDSVPYVVNAVLLEEDKAVSFTHPAFGKMWAIYNSIPDLKVGETYTVTYNGTPYECVCQTAPAGLVEDPNAVAMGNFSPVGGPNTGEPFGMLISNHLQEVDIIDLVGSSAVSVKISTEIINKLDEKLLPDGIGGINVTGAKVGQMVKISAVDENGKPTVWEPVPWGYTEGGIVEILPECQPVFDGTTGVPNAGIITQPFELVIGENYTVVFNGTEHKCVCQDAGALNPQYSGTPGMVNEGANLETGEGLVFGIMNTDFGSVGVHGLIVLPSVPTEAVTISIYQGDDIVHHPIPGELLPKGVPYVESDLVEMPFVGEWLENVEGQFGLMSQPIGLEVDKTYIVNCDGIDYEVTAIDMFALSGGEVTGVFMGNLAMFGANDNGMPFAIMESPAENVVMIAHIDGTTEHSFAIYQKSEIIHKLEGKYLPNGTPYIENEGVTETILEETTVSIVYGDQISMLDTIIPLNIGQTYIVNFNGDEYVCTASLYANGAICIGSSAGFGIQGNNEPFALFYSSGASFIACDYTIYSEVTLSVKKDITSIHKLDPRCLELDFDWVPYLNTIRGEEVFAERTTGPSLYGYSFGSSTPYYFVPNEYYLIEWNHKPYIAKYIAEEEKDHQTLYGSFITEDFVIQNVYDGTEAHGLRIRLDCRSLNDTPTDVTLAIYKLDTDNKLPNAFLNLDWLPTHEKRNHLLSQISPYGSSSLDHEDIYKLRVSGRFNLAKDTKYRMSWGENSYEVVGKDILYNDKKWDCVGNLSLLESSYEDTREPFLLIKEPDLLTTEIYVFMKTQSLPGPYLPFIYDNEIIYNKLPTEYLPDEVIKTPNNATAGDLLMFDGTNWVKYSKADLIAEIIAALPSTEERKYG